MHLLVAIAAFMLGVLPAGISPGGPMSGVSPAANAAGCCWLAPRASIAVARPARSDALLLRIGIPAYAAASGGTTIAVRIGAGPTQTRCCYGAGEHEVVFALTPGSNSPLALRFAVSPSFVPAERGIGSDSRRLTVLLHSFEPFVRREGSRAGASPLHLALLLLAGCVTAAGAFRRPALAWIVLLASDPFAFAYGFEGTTVTLGKTVLLGAIAGLASRRDARGVARELFGYSWIVASFAAFLASMLVSDVGAQDRGAALRETFLAVQYLASFAVAYVAYRLEGNDARAFATIAVTTICVATFAGGGIWFGVAQHTLIAGRVVARMAGPLEGPNQLAAFLGLALPALASRVFLRRPKALESAAFAIGVVALIGTISRAGVLCALLALLVFFVLRARPYALGKTLFVCLISWAAVFAAAIAAGAGAEPFVRMFGGHGDPYAGGLGNRAELWRGALEMWRAHPWFGVGPGNYELRIGALFPGVATHANEYYLQVLAEQGIFGIAAFLALFGGVVATLKKGIAHPFALGIFVALLGLAAHQLTDGFLLYPKVGVFMWTLVGIGLAACADRNRA
jgi:O-antigen ligase